MKETLEKIKLEKINEVFENFNGYIEITDNFKEMLLVVLSQRRGKGAINQVLMGIETLKSLFFDPIKNICFTDAMQQHGLFIYQKNGDVKEWGLENNIIEKKNAKFLDKILSEQEQELFLDKDFKIMMVECFDTLEEYKNTDKKFVLSKIFSDILGFLQSSGKIKMIFALHNDGDEPDILFSLPFTIPGIISTKLNPIHVMIDYDKITRDAQYLKINTESLEYESLKDIPKLTHSEAYKSQILLIVPVKSFESP